MKLTKSMQRSKVSSAPAELDSAITHFFDGTDNGLMLLSVPTGVGKTFQAQQYIFHHFKEKSFFYVTPLNKNVKEAYEKTRQLFKEHGLEKEFDSRAIFLQSNLDMFEEHIDSVKNILDDEITSLSSFKKLIRKHNIKDLDSEEKEEQARTESQFRNDLHKLLTDVFKTKKPQELYEKICATETYKPLIELYPSIESFKKTIFFLSVDKLYVGNSPIIETRYDFLSSKLIENAIVFLDEFDSTKEKLLGRMIQEAADDEIDLPQLFRNINDKIRGEAPSIGRDMLRDLPGKPENKTSRYAFTFAKNVFNERVEQYNLDKKFKYIGETDSQYFILSDWSLPVIAEAGKENSPKLYVSYDKENRINIVSNEKGDMKLTSVFRPLSGAIEVFVNSLKLIAGNEYDYRKQNPTGDVVTIYDCIDSVLDNYDFKPLDADWNYISPLINNKLRRKESNIKKDKFSVDFYSTGFDFVSITNYTRFAHSSKIDCISLHSTPEDYLVQLVQKTHVIGLSATAEFETVTGNFDLPYLKRKIGNLFYKIPPEDKQTIDAYIQSRLSENKSNPIVIELGADNSQTFGLEKVFCDLDDAKHFADDLIRIESKYVVGNQLGEGSVQNNCKRFSKILQAIVGFLSNQDTRVLLILSNRNVGSGSHTIDKYKSLCIESGLDVSNVEFISLTSKSWDIDMKRYAEAVGKKKVVLFTCYQAASTGQNMQFVEDLDEFERKEKDIDSIYLEYPTHQIVQNQRMLSKQTKIEAIYQIEALSETGLLHPHERRSLIKAYLSGFSNPLQNKLYSSKSTNIHILKTLCQAIGRVSRTNDKTGNAYIYFDEDVYKKVNVSSLLNGAFTKEFSAFIEHIHAKKQTEQYSIAEDDERINIAETLNDKAVQTINDFLGEWGNFDMAEMEAWSNLRKFISCHPVASSELLEKNPDYRRYYLQQSSAGPINNYYYSGNGDHVDGISYTKNSDVFFEVSEENSCLSYLIRNQLVKEEFSKLNILTKWEASEFIIIPTIYRNIYKGALGEICVRTLLGHYGIELSEIKDPSRFERFDFVVKGKEHIGIDAKFWSLSSATSSAEDLSKEVEINKVLKKMSEAGFKKSVIINVLCKNADKTLRKPHRKGEGKLLIIPSLINPDSIDASVDGEALDAINEFLEEENNGK